MSVNVIHSALQIYIFEVILILFYFTRLTDEVEMGVFVTRFVFCVILFVLGLRAPGIMTTRDYFNLSNSSTEHNIQIDVSPTCTVQNCATFYLVCVVGVWPTAFIVCHQLIFLFFVSF
jgi:hypothetical protein